MMVPETGSPIGQSDGSVWRVTDTFYHEPGILRGGVSHPSGYGRLSGRLPEPWRRLWCVARWFFVRRR
jgi:hypothetical protein